jgi:hypothetical protein
LKLLLFFSDDILDDRRGNRVPPNDILVEYSNSTGRDCAHRQLAVPGRPELADEKEIQRDPKRLRNLVRDGYATTRQRQHDDIAAARILRQVSRKGSSAPRRSTNRWRWSSAMVQHQRLR